MRVTKPANSCRDINKLTDDEKTDTNNSRRHAGVRVCVSSVNVRIAGFFVVVLFKHLPLSVRYECGKVSFPAYLLHTLGFPHKMQSCPAIPQQELFWTTQTC